MKNNNTTPENMVITPERANIPSLPHAQVTITIPIQALSNRTLHWHESNEETKLCPRY